MSSSGKPFVAWGVNYDHDPKGRLLEDYWDKEWALVEADFREIKALGVNVVRIHLQVARFLDAPLEPNRHALRQLTRLVALAEKTGLYLDLTGLGCYHRKDVPPWYDALSEAKRWAAQAVFWEAVAATCAKSPAIFCYDLMNEPIVPGDAKKETEWLVGEFAGSTFVQRLTLDLAGRTQEQVIQAWLELLTRAIRKHDPKRLLTVGVIPWAMVFPGARPLFYTPDVVSLLDFISVHVYPKAGKVPEALVVLKTYPADKPLVIEEIFPLECGLPELDAFIDSSRTRADGWISFYWGKDNPKAWLEYFRKHPLREAGGGRGEAHSI